MKLKTLTLSLATLSLATLGTVTAHGVFGMGGGNSRLAEFDADGDGTLSEEEREAARAAREEARQAIIDEFDADGDGVLNEEERAAAKEARQAERAAAREARFAEIDGEEGDGEITQEELQAALPDASEERVAAVLARYDADENGTVSLEEFVNPTRPDRGSRARGGVRKGFKVKARKGPRGGRAIVIRGWKAPGGNGGDDAPAPAGPEVE